MTTPAPSSPAVVCTQCRKQMDTPLCCASCGSLNPVPPGGFNYFEIFGVPAGFELDTGALRRKYLALSRGVHPDVRESHDDSTRGRALDLSGELNRAYDTLRDPVARAEYLLLMAGGPTAAEHKTVPGCLLGEIMVFREETEEARQAGNTAKLQALQVQIQNFRQEAVAAVAGLCRNLSADAAGQVRLREHLNVIKYWNNLLEQLSNATAR